MAKKEVIQKLRLHADYTGMKREPFPAPDEIGYVDDPVWPKVLILCSLDCSQMDLSAYDPQFIEFDEKTKWPTDKAKMPKDFDPKAVMEQGKDTGLNVKKLHKQGITGKGIRVAIIDQPLASHKEYNDQLVHYEEIGVEEDIQLLKKEHPEISLDSFEPKGSMHGSAVASLLVGKECGVAPEAELYHFARYLARNEKGEETCENEAKALERILQINKKLPKEERIQVVSISWNAMADPKFHGYERFHKVAEKLIKQGVFICDVGCSAHNKLGQKMDFFGANREMNGNPNDSSIYSVRSFFKDSLLFPRAQRTTACPQGNDMYVHYGNGGESWRVPCTAGMFALARQVNPDITPEQFYQLGLKTGKEINGNFLVQPEALIEAVKERRVQALVQDKEQAEKPKTKSIGLKQTLKNAIKNSVPEKCPALAKMKKRLRQGGAEK